MTDKDFTYKSHGANSKGNHWCARDYGSDAPNDNSCHYSNSDGSYYYSNPDGSKYHNDGKGGATYTTPDVYRFSKTNEFGSWAPAPSSSASSSQGSSGGSQRSGSSQESGASSSKK